MRLAALVATLFGFWLLLSGIYTPFLVLTGLAASVAVAALAWRMEVADREGHPIHLTLGALAYWPWLVTEIVRSGWQVARSVVDPRLPISPTLARFRPSQTTSRRCGPGSTARFSPRPSRRAFLKCGA